MVTIKPTRGVLDQGPPGCKVRQTPARLITSLRDRGLHGRAVRRGCPGSTPGATVHEPGDLEGVRRPCRVVLPRTSRGGLLPAGKSSAQPGERARPVPRGARPCLCYSRLLPSAPCSPEKPPPKNPAAMQVPFTRSLQPQCPARPHGGLSKPRSLNGILNSVPHSYQLHCKRLTATCDWELPSWTRVTDGLSGQPQPGGPSPGAAALAHCNPRPPGFSPPPRSTAPPSCQAGRPSLSMMHVTHFLRCEFVLPTHPRDSPSHAAREASPSGGGSFSGRQTRPWPDGNRNSAPPRGTRLGGPAGQAGVASHDAGTTNLNAYGGQDL